MGSAREAALLDGPISRSRIMVKATDESHGGGTIEQRRWRFKSKASHNGKFERCGGRRAGVGPYLRLFVSKFIPLTLRSELTMKRRLRDIAYAVVIPLTPSKGMLSSRCRGIMVMVSISQRNAISEGERPACTGMAIVRSLSKM